MSNRFCKGFRHVSDIQPSSQSETLGKKIVCLGKVYEVDYAKLVCEYPQFPLWAALIKKASFCSCFRREAILLKKVSIFFKSSILPILKFQKRKTLWEWVAIFNEFLDYALVYFVLTFC